MIRRKAVFDKKDLDAFIASAKGDAQTWTAEKIMQAVVEFVADSGFLFRKQDKAGGTTVSEQDLRGFWRQLGELYKERGGAESFPEILPPQTYTAGPATGGE